MLNYQQETRFETTKIDNNNAINKQTKKNTLPRCKFNQIQWLRIELEEVSKFSRGVNIFNT